MSFGLGVLRLSPVAFWSMTMVEISAAMSVFLGAGNGADAMNRQNLAHLMAAFPDNRASHTDEGDR